MQFQQKFCRKGTQRAQREELTLFLLCDLCVLLWLILLVAALSRCAVALRSRAMRGKMFAKRRAAGLGCGGVKIGIADNGNEPLVPREKAGAELDLD